MKKAQNISIDLLIAVMIFLVVIVVFYYLSFKNTPLQTSEELKSDALKISTQLEDSSKYGVIDEYKNLNLERLEELYSMNASQLQRELGISSKFCIYVEDSEGHVLVINNKTGTGFSDIKIAGYPCGSKI